MPIAPAETDDGGMAYGWWVASTRAGTLERVAVEVSGEHRITSLSCGGFRLDRLSYGPRLEAALSPPAWPERSLQDIEELDATAMMKLMAVVAQAMKPVQP